MPKIDKELNENSLDGLPFMELYYKYIDSNYTLTKDRHVEI